MCIALIRHVRKGANPTDARKEGVQLTLEAVESCRIPNELIATMLYYYASTELRGEVQRREESEGAQ